MFFLVGPTAAGKSEIAVAVAERCGAEIVGADAFQIYEGMEILTAKPAPELRRRVPHHLIGSAPLAETFDAGKYRAAARDAIREIEARGKRVLVVGGTGFYVTALARGLAELPSADAALRAELDALSLAELQGRYRALDPVGAAQIDVQNPRRLIRAVEVSILTGQPFSKFKLEEESRRAAIPGVLLMRDRDDLDARIQRRTAEMFTRGLLDEVRALPAVGPTASQAIGLREVRACLAGEISVEETTARIDLATRRYAKRQLTWFRREPSLSAFNLSNAPSIESLISLIARQLGDTSLPMHD